MSDVVFTLPLGQKVVNPARLHEELRAAVGMSLSGVSSANDQWAACFVATPNEAQMAAAVLAFNAHDAAQLTPEQQAEALRQQAEAAAHTAAVSALQGYNAVMADLTDNWTGLTAGAKLEAVRAGVVVALRLARWLVARVLA